MISDWIIGKIIKLHDCYTNWRYPKKFNIGDKVKREDVITFWQDLTVIGYDFYYDDWWVFVTEEGNSRPLPMEESKLTLVEPVIKEYKYDPNQTGDREDDI